LLHVETAVSFACVKMKQVEIVAKLKLFGSSQSVSQLSKCTVLIT